MKSFFFLLLFIISGLLLHAQAPPPPPAPPNGTDTVLGWAEKMPQFPGGEDAFVQYLQQNIKYPAAEKKAGVQGVVYVSFTIEKDGSIANVQVPKGVPDGPGLSAEAVRVISAMPNWTPGEMNGKKVAVNMTQPIRFVLDDPKDSAKAVVRDSNYLYMVADVMPVFPGGDSAFAAYVKKNLKYPEDEKTKKLEGKVLVMFTIERDGSVSHVRVIRSVPGAPGFDAEAIRVISAMPKWTPGTVQGKAVRVQLIEPVNFVLK